MTGRDVRADSLGPYRKPPPRTIAIPDTLAFLRGRWRLERRLSDHRSGVCGTFTGDAEFAATDDPAVLRYVERGELRFGGHAGPADPDADMPRPRRRRGGRAVRRRA